VALCGSMWWRWIGPRTSPGADDPDVGNGPAGIRGGKEAAEAFWRVVGPDTGARRGAAFRFPGPLPPGVHRHLTRRADMPITGGRFPASRPPSPGHRARTRRI